MGDVKGGGGLKPFVPQGCACFLWVSIVILLKTTSKALSHFGVVVVQRVDVRGFCVKKWGKRVKSERL